jgi:hypothetical protein
MAMGRSATRQIRVRLIHDGVQPGAPLTGPLRFGVQDTNGEVHAPSGTSGETRHFDLALEVRGGDETSMPVLSGAFAHGPPAGRFLYLSWKREGKHDAPWAWRIKVPLSGIGWGDIRAAEKDGRRLEANVVGRRPHSTDAIEWRLVKSRSP